MKALFDLVIALGCLLALATLAGAILITVKLWS